MESEKREDSQESKSGPFLFDTLPQGVLYRDADGRVISVNPAAREILGLTSDDLEEQTRDLCRQAIREDGSPLPDGEHPAMLALRTGQPVRNVIMGVFNPEKERLRWLRVDAVPLFTAGDSAPAQVYTTFNDITEQKRNIDILSARLRLLEFSAGHTLDEVMQATLDEAELLTGSLIGFYHFLEEDQKTLSLQAWSTRTMAQFCKAEGKGLHYPVSQAGVWVDCIHQRKPVIHNDYASLVHRKGLPPGHAAVISEMVVPIMREGKIVAILGVGNKPAAYTSVDVETVSLLADLLWDIAARKFIEQQLGVYAGRYRTLVNSTPDSLFVIDRQGTIIDANPQSCLTFGYGREELLGMPLGKLEAVETSREITAHLEKIACTGFERFEVCHWAKDGRKLNIEVSAALIPETGEIIGFNRNITASKQMEESLRESEARYRALFESMVEGVALLEVICDEAGNPREYRFLDSNPTFQRLTNLDRQSILGRTIKEVLPQTEDGQLKIYDRVVLTGEAAEIENYARELDRFYRVKCFSPAPRRFGMIFEETTARKKEEAELIKVQRLESLGLLAGGIAHDFNNVLTAIMGNITVVRMLVGEEHKVGERLDECEKAARRAGEMTRQLLTFAKGGEPVRIVIDPQRLLEESLNFSLRGSKVRGVVDCPGDIWRIDADAGQISQVFNNLLINARQAMVDGGSVVVRMENQEVRAGDPLVVQPGRYVRVEVTDQGTGIAPEHLPKVFDPYFTTKAKGSGLGLASVYSIMKRHGGMVTVSSRPGHGSTFTLLIPAGKQMEKEKQGPAHDMSIRQGTAKILIMDDESMIRDVAVLMLEKLGYAVDTCHDGAEAVALHAAACAQGAPYAAIILDLTVPGGMGGKNAAALIRQRDAEVPLIVSSGYSSDAVVARYEDYGFSGAVAKPYGMRDMASELERVIGAIEKQ